MNAVASRPELKLFKQGIVDGEGGGGGGWEGSEL